MAGKITIAERPKERSLDLDSAAMTRIGERVVPSIRSRIERGYDVNDQPAPPLRQSSSVRRNGFARVIGYAQAKVSKYGGRPIRNWKRTGETLGAMGVLQASTNRVVIGFRTLQANIRAAKNNARWPQFGMAPSDQSVLVKAIESERE